jgi:hypothetical protein
MPNDFPSASIAALSSVEKRALGYRGRYRLRRDQGDDEKKAEPAHQRVRQEAAHDTSRTSAAN